MIERISEAFDEIDSDLMLELTAADQEYSDVKHKMSDFEAPTSFYRRVAGGR